MIHFTHGPAHFPNELLTLAYQTNYNTVCLDTRLKLTGLFKLWIALHSSSHSVMSQTSRSSSSIFHRHVARTFAPEFPILFKLKLSFFICTEGWKTEVGFALDFTRLVIEIKCEMTYASPQNIRPTFHMWFANTFSVAKNIVKAWRRTISCTLKFFHTSTK